LSVHLPKGETPDFSAFLAQYPQIEIIKTDRHNKKLRPGDHISNSFVVTMSEVTDVADVVRRLETIMETGVPNYFGTVKLVVGGVITFVPKTKTSAACFFPVLVHGFLIKSCLRVLSKTSLHKLSANNDMQISAAMAGDNALPTQDDALLLEQPCLDSEPDLMALIRGNRMRHDRRSIALKAQDLTWSVEGDNITLSFSLDCGCFATSIVRELIEEIEVERVYS